MKKRKPKRSAGKRSNFMLVIDILVHTLRHASKHDESISYAERFDEGVEVYPSIIQAIEYILEHFTEEIDVKHLLKMAGKQRSAFYRTFKSVTGTTPNTIYPPPSHAGCQLYASQFEQAHYGHRIRMRLRVHSLLQ